MSRVAALSTSLRAELATLSPAARGLLLGVALLVLETFLEPFDTATSGVIILVGGVALAAEGRDWWPDAGRLLAAAGGVLVLGSLLVPF
ncbi:hypothetical protein [Haloglomus salinum]|uniref:hypothetical protein n=1 Tax=Haloglomus salinum TaxID=2962673 RepID=UPI0020C9D25D|nr:hypothetical protein [Haloglomus salinum]